MALARVPLSFQDSFRAIALRLFCLYTGAFLFALFNTKPALDARQPLVDGGQRRLSALLRLLPAIRLALVVPVPDDLASNLPITLYLWPQ